MDRGELSTWTAAPSQLQICQKFSQVVRERLMRAPEHRRKNGVQFIRSAKNGV